jgi:hypothetical protein
MLLQQPNITLLQNSLDCFGVLVAAVIVDVAAISVIPALEVPAWFF